MDFVLMGWGKLLLVTHEAKVKGGLIGLFIDLKKKKWLYDTDSVASTH